MTDAPSRQLTFLFTDIEGSTRLAEGLGPAYEAIRAQHERLLRAAWAAHGGTEIDAAGDGFFVVFHHPSDALSAATSAQRALEAEAWPTGWPVRVRMGIHTGEAVLTGDQQRGRLEVHRAARVAATGHGGQVIISDATRQLTVAALPADVTLRDMGVHRLKDLAHPEHLWQLVIDGLANDFPPLRTLERHPHNLPVEASSFLGREAELSQLSELLSHSRLLTLTGPGGTGKTRLALRLAAERIQHFPDGAFFVGLAAVSDPELVMSAIATSLSLRESAGLNLAESVAEYLREKELLLLVDNFEHLAAAVPRIADLLAAAPRLRIVVTSRSPLRLTGEQEYPVPPLGLPDAAASVSAELLGRSEAGRLFYERARQVQPSFELDDANAREIAAICSALDGLPLAIELAAARTKLLTPAQLLVRLERRLPLLTGGAADAPARQRTLTATIAWSHDLLSESERALFRRLSVFAGGAALEAVGSICNPGEELGDTLELAGALMDHSLLRRVEQPDTTARFRMLQVLREFAEVELVRAGEQEVVRERHAGWCRALAEEAEPHLTGPQQAQWLDRLEAEHGNLRAAFAWATEDGERATTRATTGVEIAGAMWRFWYYRSHLAEGGRTLAAVLKAPHRAAAEVLAKATNGAGAIAWEQGNYPLAREHFARHLGIRRDLGDIPEVLKATNNLAVVCQDSGDLEEAVELYRECLDGFRSIGDDYLVAMSLGNLATVWVMQSRLPEAASAVEESLAIIRELGDKNDLVMTLTNLAVIVLQQGDVTRSHALLREAGALLDEVTTPRPLPAWLDALSELFAACAHTLGSARMAAAAETLRETAGIALAEFETSQRARHIDRARRGTSPSDWDAAWQEGSHWDASTALREARSDLENLDGNALADLRTPARAGG